MEIQNQTAAKNITKNIPIVSADYTIWKVKSLLGKKSNTFDTINYVYVVDKFDHLKGVFSIKDLFKYDNQINVSKIMTTDLATCRATSDQQKIVRIALKNNIKAVPVVSKQKKFLGVVPSDQILKILNFEHSEDLLRLSGIIPTKDFFPDTSKISVIKSFIARLPWIIVGIIGGVFAAKIVGLFESTLERELTLATFIPLIVYISDAVGTQTQTIFIRDIAFNPKIPLFLYSLKQTLINTLVGAICSLLVYFVILTSWQSNLLALTVSFSIFIAIFMATSISIIIPWILKLLKTDPAIGSGPFTTIIQDILSVLVYMLIALYFYRI